MTVPLARGPWPKVAFAQKSDPGREPTKQVNEDAAHYQETAVGHLVVVCDGMGGHMSGREASQLAIKTIFEEVARAPAGSPPGETLRAAIVEAGRRVYELGGPAHNPTRPGSTCVAILIHPLGTEVAHIGDSRAYVVRGGKIWPLTRDHSMVQQLVDAGLLRKEDAASHPDANKILKALGMSPDAEVELRPEPIVQEARDLFLLVSDGVTDVVTDSDLLAMATVAVETGNVAALCDQIVQLANARGGPDNITVQAALVVDPGLRPDAAKGRALVLPTVTGEDAAPQRSTSPGEPPPETVRIAAATPSPKPKAAADVAPPSPPARGRGATVKLAVHTAGDAKKPPPTIVDEATVDTPEETPPLSSRAEAPASRGARVAIGAGLFVVGAIVATVSFRALLFVDEAPPPLDEAPAAPSSSAVPLPIPSASR